MVPEEFRPWTLRRPARPSTNGHVTSESDELTLLRWVDDRARAYVGGVDQRPVFPSPAAIDALAAFEEPWSEEGRQAHETLRMLDRVGTPATVTSNGPNYFGFVIGATLPAAAAAERLALAWDQCASGFANSPAVAAIEAQASRWVLEALNLPTTAAVGFGTSATACGLGCLATARRALLERQRWDVDRDGVVGAPEIRVVLPASVHITIKKILRLLGFGERHLVFAPVDEHNRVRVEALPEIDERTIVCLQAGEVNTGEFDPFGEIIPKARAAGAWVHVDGAFGLWARASAGHRHLTDGVEAADSWTTDGHKWLNTPYDGAMAICRHPALISATMNADAPYATAEPLAQKNLTTEFSRRARGVAVWAALRTLGRSGVDEIVARHCRQAKRLAEGLASVGVEVVNRVVLNQVLARLGDDDATRALIKACQASGEVWFGPGVWQDRAAFRLSVSSWRTTDAHIERAIETIGREVSRRR